MLVTTQMHNLQNSIDYTDTDDSQFKENVLAELETENKTFTKSINIQFDVQDETIPSQWHW